MSKLNKFVNANYFKSKITFKRRGAKECQRPVARRYLPCSHVKSCMKDGYPNEESLFYGLY